MTSPRTLVLAAAMLLCVVVVANGSWLPEERLSDLAGLADSTSPVNARCIGCDHQGNVSVVWYSSTAPGRRVIYKRWDATAGQWAEAETISPTGMVARKPTLSVDDSGGVHVVWQAGTAICYGYRNPRTGEWGPTETIDSMASAGNPCVAARRSGFVAAVWQADPSVDASHIFYSCRTGAGWSVPESVSSGGTPGEAYPSVTVDTAATTWVLWVSYVNSGTVRARERAQTGWQPQRTMFDGGAGAQPVSLSSGQSGDLHALWSTGVSRDDARLLHRPMLDGSWRDSVVLPQISGDQQAGSLTDDELGRASAVWVARTGSTYGLYYSIANTRGDTWSQPVPLAQQSRQPASPSVTTGPLGAVAVVWTDYRLGSSQPDIYCRRYYEWVRDVGVDELTATMPVDSGVPFTLSAWLQNHGDSTELDVPISFSVADNESTIVWDSVAAGGSALVSWDSCVVHGSGWVEARCSTYIGGDLNRGNEVARCSIFVRVLDAAVDSIVVPSAAETCGVLAPSVRLRNLGNDTGQTSAVFLILNGTDTTYRDARAVSLRPGADTVVDFASWTTEPGEFVARCSLSCGRDLHPENDTLSRQFRVVLRDVGVSRITWPVGTVDSTDTVLPQAEVENTGSESAVFDVMARIGDQYADTVRGVSLDPGGSTQVSFRGWHPEQRGDVTVRCSTMLAGDVHPDNDCRSCTVFVRVADAAALRVVCPIDTVSPALLVPALTVANYGTEAGSVPSWLVILDQTGVLYAESQSVWLEPRDSADVACAAWQPPRSGDYSVKGWTALADDMVAANDTAHAGFHVATCDAELRAIESPATVEQAGSVVPRLHVANLGEMSGQIHVRLRIGAAYDESTTVTVSAGQSAAVGLPTWDAVPGAYWCVASAWTPMDENPLNDTQSMAVQVESVYVRRWTRLADLPVRRGVKSGGSICRVGSGMLALKGGNTAECWEFLDNGDSWRRCADLPAGASGKRPRHGAALCSDGLSAAFALKGNRTHELWRYDLAGDSWHQLASAPEFTREFRFGSGVVYLAGDTNRLFVVKASGTREFLVYWIEPKQWHSRRPLPAGPSGLAARHGTALTEMGGRVFCLKGGTREFYEYFSVGDSWRARSSLPWTNGVGRHRKVRRGAALASDGGRYCYAFKGGGSNEFWRYDRQSDTWVQLEDVPDVGRRRKVRDGGALARYVNELYALKGGGSREFWRFDPDAGVFAGERPARTVVQAEVGVGPVRPVGRVGQVEGQVYDAAGRRVAAGARRPGIYFVRNEQDGFTRTIKLVVAR
jgi:hypothetical protein